jgi:endonuclease/exonuclease/phosphatase family metal-dependent hydrolase
MIRVLLLLALLLPVPASAEDLKIATWNLNWLTTRVAGDHALPSDVQPRNDQDFDRLAQYAQELNADLIAIEEVDGFKAASKLFPRDRYSIHMTRDHVVQRVGIVVRRGLHYDANSDLTELSENHLRSGADITLHLSTSDLRVLAVHLKTGCWTQPMPKTQSPACRELLDQEGPLQSWISDRKSAGEAFLVLGDFNRAMEGRDTFFAALQQAAPLVRATAGHSSPCWGGGNFIDHILAGGPAAQWMQPDSLKVLVYRETDPTLKERLSDHCPVSVRLAVPD